MEFLTDRRIAAILLILCSLVFLVAGILYTGRAIWKWPAAQTQTHLIWERSFVITAALINVMGFVLLQSLLNSAGDSIIARLALPIYLIATAVLLAAEGTYLNTRDWVYPQIILYVVLAFLAQAAFGVALLRTGLVPAWAGWATVVWNLAWLVILPLASPQDIYFPVLHHVAPLLIGIALLTS
jgi:hypothetical protein